MEYSENRDSYIREFHEFCDSVDLSQDSEFFKELQKSKLFKSKLKIIMDTFKDEKQRKIVILLEFTRERLICNEVVQLLSQTGQKEQSAKLLSFNKSKVRMKPMETDFVRTTKTPKESSDIFSFSKFPRGMCVIINNAIKFDANNEPIKSEELYRESERFEYIFWQLYFLTEVKYGLTTKQIKDYLQKVSENPILKDHEALVVIIISHGEDDSILGYDNNDSLAIPEIVNIFADKQKCQLPKNSPKLFFFDCCRIKVPPLIKAKIPLTQFKVKITKKEVNWVNENENVFIGLSCSDGGKSYFSSKFPGFTDFGLALGDSIIQYACDKDIGSILSKTCDYLSSLVESSNGQISGPEVRHQFLKKQIYFNPGYIKRD